MNRILELLCQEGYKVLKQSPSSFSARSDCGDLVRREVSGSVQDVDGQKIFINGWLSVKEIIGENTLEGEDVYWELVGREVGPNGMFPFSSHSAGGWALDRETEAYTTVREKLLPWLDIHSHAERLIEMAENLYFDGERIPRPEAKFGLARVLLQELGIGTKKEAEYDVIHRPKYSHILGVLHYSTGNREKAAFYINRWIEQRGEANVDPAYPKLLAELGIHGT